MKLLAIIVSFFLVSATITSPFFISMIINLKSKYSIAQAVLIPAYVLLATFGISGILLFAGVKAHDKSDNVGILLFIFGLVFLSMTLLILRHYIGIFNQITLDLEGIRIKGVIKDKMIKWIEIEKINLLGKEYETFLFTSMPMEAISIITSKGDKEVLFVKVYSNMDKIRTALHLINTKLKRNEKISSSCFVEVKRDEVSALKTGNLKKYSGNHLLTFNGIIVYGSIIFILWLFLWSDSPMNTVAKILFSAFILLFSFGFLGYQLHYFEINEEYFIVKNHVWIWRNDIYKIKDLREVVFEMPHKMSTSLRVITNNYETKLYPAGSLKTAVWNRVSNELTQMKVPVRNEAYLDC